MHFQTTEFSSILVWAHWKWNRCIQHSKPVQMSILMTRFEFFYIFQYDAPKSRCRSKNRNFSNLSIIKLIRTTLISWFQCTIFHRACAEINRDTVYFVFSWWDPKWKNEKFPKPSHDYTHLNQLDLLIPKIHFSWVSKRSSPRYCSFCSSLSI